MWFIFGSRRFRGSRKPPDPGFRRRARIPPGFQQKSLKRAPFSRGYRKTPVIAGRFSRPCLPGPWAPISVSGPRIPPDSKSLATAAPPAVQNRPPMCPPPGWGGDFTRGGAVGRAGRLLQGIPAVMLTRSCRQAAEHVPVRLPTRLPDTIADRPGRAGMQTESRGNSARRRRREHDRGIVS